MKRKFISVIAAMVAAAYAFAGCACGTVANEVETDVIRTFDVDGVKVTWLRDNAESKLNPVSLFPGATDEIVSQLGLQDGIPASMSAFLVRTEGENLLFDAGLGTPGSLLMHSLDTLGVKPEDIGHIFITHMHFDHIGGLMRDGQAAFPNAKLWVSAEELDAWLNMDGQQSGAAKAVAAMYSDRLMPFGAADSLPCGVQAIDAKGHTPGHTVYRVGDVLIAGDIMHAVALQNVYPTVNALYDMDQEQSVASRVAVMEYARTEGLLVCGMHFPDPGVLDFRDGE